MVLLSKHALGRLDRAFCVLFRFRKYSVVGLTFAGNLVAPAGFKDTGDLLNLDKGAALRKRLGQVAAM